MQTQAFLGRMITSAALLLGSAACAFGVGAAGDIPPPTQLEVTNQSGGPIEVWAAGSGTSYRIGTVHPGLTERFALRRGMVINGAVQFTARSADGHIVQSGPMLLRSGDVVDFALTPHTATSTATVRAWVPGSLSP
jgi:hypothetical protein